MSKESRPVRIEELDCIYDDMITRNSVISSWKYDATIGLDDTRGCVAIYSYGSWNLLPIPWKRLQGWLEPFLEYGIKYSVNPSELEGRLHFTFHQLSGFSEMSEISEISQSKFKDFMNELRGIKIEFRGLLITPTGLALRGYPSDEIQLKRLMRLRDSLGDFCKSNNIPYNPPYINNIIHSTLFRWTRPLSTTMVQKLQHEISQWNECWFGSCTFPEWVYGLGTLLMREPHVKDLVSVKTPILIAHRGLTCGPSKKDENNIDSIQKRTELGLYSEIDVWYINNEWFLGHDGPETKITFDFLLKNSNYIWIHTKNKEAFEILVEKRKEGYNFCIFWHTTEDYCFTTNLDIIVYPGKELLNYCVFMMPENSDVFCNKSVDYICSDYGA